MKELLLLLCHYPFDEENRETLSNLIKQVDDWPSLIRQINDHGITALAAYNLKEAGLESEIPKFEMTYLNNGYLQNILRNTWMNQQWKEVNNIFCDAGIKHILLKGIALEHTIYGSRGLRQMNDHDIYIEWKDSSIAWNLLQKNGFTVEPVKSKLIEKISPYISEHLPTLYKNGYALEIHNRLFIDYANNRNGLFEKYDNPLEIYIDGVKALTLPQNIHLNYLVKHFEGHTRIGDCQLRSFADILLLDKKTRINVPDTFLSNPLQSSKLEFRKTAYKMTLKEIPLYKRWKFILGDIFPSIEWMKKRYRCGWLQACLYYPVRIVKLTWII